MDSINSYQFLDALLRMNIGDCIKACDVNNFVCAAMCKGIATKLDYDDFEQMCMEYPVEIQVSRTSILIRNRTALRDKLRHRLRFVLSDERTVQIRMIWDEKNT